MTENKIMKEKKHTQPSPIIFKLSNQPPLDLTNSVIINSIGILIMIDEETVTQYFEHLNYFTIDNFNVFAFRLLDKKNKELNMNQQHLIIYYATLHLMILALGSTKLTAVLKSKLEESSIEIFDSGKDEMVELCRTSKKTAQRDYKNNNAIIAAFAKIDAYSIIG